MPPFSVLNFIIHLTPKNQYLALPVKWVLRALTWIRETHTN